MLGLLNYHKCMMDFHYMFDEKQYFQYTFQASKVVI